MSILRHFVVPRFILAAAFVELISIIISGSSIIVAEISIINIRL